MRVEDQKTNVLKKFHEYWTLNLTSRVLTRYFYSHIKLPNPWRPSIRRTNVLTKFHVDWNINVTSGVLTIFHYKKNCHAPWCPYVIVKNTLTTFHDDWTINVTPRVLTRKTATLPGSHFHEDWTINVDLRMFNNSHILKTAPSPCDHVFQPTETIFEHS
ncbi:hypothetical protein DPMN_194689 [Dreissena polymorpha]|uniref:Uncharacterized protein n=1 Tax=Dreissena polymorpha TaxID=45954 RepID=A0A9D3XWJ5_DREPO|nr:hypothetical protein DPMN_194689 [Dreissena polymorpha]